MSENNFVKLGDVAHECRLTWSGGQTDIPIVGLEHLVPGEIELSSWDSNIEHTFSKKFLKGQVLLGRRRVYLKKAVVAPCDGICSGDITVIESTGGILPELLPFVIQNDRFFDYAMQGSAGSLSPRVKWEHLKNYEFSLPPLAEQKVLADKLWAAYRLKESYKKLLAATEEMVKSQFIEMFGTVKSTKPLTDFIDVSFPGEWGQEDKDGSGVKVIRTTNFTNNGKLDLSDVVTRGIDYAKVEKKKLSKGDIILERSGGTNDNPVGRVVYFEEDGVYLFNNFTQLLRCKEGVNSLFLFYSLFNYYQMNKNVIRSMSNKTTGIQNLKMDRYWQIPIADVSIERQKEFESIYRQADKSGFDGRKSQFIEMFGNPLSQVQRYPLEKLGDCCVLNPRRPSISLSDTDMVSFVPMPCVSENGYLQDVADEEYGKVKKGFTYFENKDVLFAKITPCMENGKGAIAQELTNGIGMGSTEFHVLRPIEGKSNSYWLLALTRMPIFREQASKNMSGTGGQKRVGASFLDNFMVGLPPIEEQNRFERIYRQADKSGSVLLKLSSR